MFLFFLTNLYEIVDVYRKKKKKIKKKGYTISLYNHLFLAL